MAGRRGGAEMVVFFREGSMTAQSDRAQLGVWGGAQNKGASKRCRIGIWSEPVEGRGSDHCEKSGERRGQAKARSRTLGRPTSDMGSRVKTAGVFRRENPTSVALAKYLAIHKVFGWFVSLAPSQPRKLRPHISKIPEDLYLHASHILYYQITKNKGWCEVTRVCLLFGKVSLID